MDNDDLDQKNPETGSCDLWSLQLPPSAQEKSIGLDFALFYEALATYYELKGNGAAADGVYTDGINR